MEMRTMLVVAVVVDVEEFPGTELGPGDESHISHGRENKTITLTARQSASYSLAIIDNIRHPQ